MKEPWQHAAEQHEGKNAALVTAMHDAILGATQTVEGRTEAAFKAFLANAETLSSSGASADDMFDALEHFMSCRRLIVGAIQRGI